MKIPINKDFLTEYKDDAWKGFSIHELITLAIAAVIGFSIMGIGVFRYGFDPSIMSYVCIPFVLPVLMYGFYRYQNYMPVNKLVVEMYYTNQLDCLTIADVHPPIKEVTFSMNKCPEIRDGKEES